MCNVLLPPGVNSIAVNKYIMPYHYISLQNISEYINQTKIKPQKHYNMRLQDENHINVFYLQYGDYRVSETAN